MSSDSSTTVAAQPPPEEVAANQGEDGAGLEPAGPTDSIERPAGQDACVGGNVFGTRCASTPGPAPAPIPKTSHFAPMAGKLVVVPKIAATVKLDDDVLTAVRLEAARSGRSEDEVVEAAVRRYVGPSVLDRLAERNRLEEDEAMVIALEEIGARRRERRGG